MIFVNDFGNGTNYKSGIYRIDITNGMFYIGSATILRTRFCTHRNNLKSNKHDNSIMQNICSKHGIDSFTFSVLELCEKKDLINREQYYIDLLKPNINISKKAGATYGLKHWVGKKHSEETKKKIRESNIKTKALNKKPQIKRLTKEQAFEKFIAQTKTKESRERSRQNMLGNKYWLGRKHKPETIIARIGGGNPNAKPVVCDELGITFNTCKEAASFFNVSKALITKVLNGKAYLKHNDIICKLRLKSQT